MPFVLPELDEIGYRLWRLRRLILIGALAPALLWFLIGLAAWPFTGLAPGGSVTLFLFAAVILGLHAMLFPNANEETLTLSLGLMFLTLVEPLTGFSILARLAEWGVVAAALVLLPPRLVDVLARLRPIRHRSTSRVVTEKTADQARRHFPARPEQELPYRLCGPADAEGRFPVTLVPSGPLGFNAGIDTAAGPAGPHVWARIVRNEPSRQETEFLSRDAAGQFELVSRLVHDIVAAPGGVRVVETEEIDGLPLGVSLLLWLTDYQCDGLIQARDMLEGRTSMALRQAPRVAALDLVRSTILPEWAADRS